MYEVTVLYKQRSKILAIKKKCDFDTYELSMDSVESLLKKHHIKEDQIVSYKVIKTLNCLHCSQKNYLTKQLNICECGATYNIFGEEIAVTETKALV
jgi:hypothetical protein